MEYEARRRRLSSSSVCLNAILVLSLLLTPYCLRSQNSPGYRFASSPDAWLAPVSMAGALGSWALLTHPPELSDGDLSLLRREDVPVFDRFAVELSSGFSRKASDVALVVSVVAPMLVLTEFGGDYMSILGMYAETIGVTATITNLAKLSGRIRPFAYNTEEAIDMRRSPDMRRSFFSGHTSASMAAGVFLATVYDRYRPGSSTAKALWIGGIGMGLLTGTFRILSGMHFPSDVLVGTIVGAAVGYAVPRMHEVEREYLNSVVPAGGRAPRTVTLVFVL